MRKVDAKPQIITSSTRLRGSDETTATVKAMAKALPS